MTENTFFPGAVPAWQLVEAAAALAELSAAARYQRNFEILRPALLLKEAQDCFSLSGANFTFLQLAMAMGQDAIEPIAGALALYTDLQSLGSLPPDFRTAGLQEFVEKLDSATATSAVDSTFHPSESSYSALLNCLISLRRLHRPSESTWPRHFDAVAIHYVVAKYRILPRPCLRIAAYLKNTSDEYNAWCRALHLGESEAGLLHFLLDALQSSAVWTRWKLDNAALLLESTAEKMRSTLPKIYSRELVEILFQRPCCRISDLVEAKIAVRNTASNYLNTFAGVGLLDIQKVGRDAYFINRRFIDLLEAPPTPPS